ncbi:two-component regulator propeller domain-containing protein [Sediminitomix flava]|uniref:histidine kinase n=1 Tax=Sediminitomix flava TaxID=379075 RepID=A0A315ZGD6_SEDFL|nr:two-component regulator propeller domain-containing protein [Sediminitomix flava]PWJ44180.1 signal transduction histidine kinase [Sediminitomix flava]
MKYFLHLRIILSLILMMPLSLKVFSQDNISFTHIHKGLSQKTVSTILRDQDGFMWFGTRYGLNKYDGKQFYSYIHAPENVHSISSNNVRSMVMDSLGNFWIAAEAEGLDYFDTKKDIFINFNHDANNPNSLSEKNTSTVFIDKNHQLWVGTENKGLNLYSAQSQSFKHYLHDEHEPKSISHNHIMDIEEDHLGNLWVATLGGGLNLFNPKDNSFLSLSRSNGLLSNDFIFSLGKSKTGLWIGSEKGLYHLSIGEGLTDVIIKEIDCVQKGLLQELQSYTILSVVEDELDHVWIGTENGGLYLYDQKTKNLRVFTSDKGDNDRLASNSIWSLFVDKSNTLWVGTFNNGVNKYDRYQRKFKHIFRKKDIKNTLSYNTISSFAQDEKGNLWIGTDGGGLNYYNEKTGAYTYFKHDKKRALSLVSDAVLNLLIDKEGDLWIATWQGGLSKKIKGKDAFIHYPLNGFKDESKKDDYAYFLMEDQNENIWVSMFRGGVGIFDKKTESFRTLEVSDTDALAISSSKNRVIHQTDDGVIWLGTEGSGLDKLILDENYKIIEKTNYEYRVADSLSMNHNTVTTIHEDRNGDLWIGTFGGGINILDRKTETFSYITSKTGLTGNVILGIESDHDGGTWVTTSQGLNLIHPNGKIEVFDTEDGVQDAEYVKNASFVSPDGELFFGGINGFNRFYPKDINRNKEIPEVLLTGFSVSDNADLNFKNGRLLSDIYPESRIVLDHNQNDFEFDFSVLNYSQPSQNQYAYMLYPYNTEWIHVQPNDRINYTNVPPGEYEFRVKGANNDGVWNEEGSLIYVFIDKPWWETNLAYFCYFGLFLFALFMVRRTTLARERLKNRLEIEHFELEKLHEMDEIKSRFFANISHEFRTPLTLIIDPIKALLSNNYQGDVDNLYQIMLKNAERLLHLINELLELSKLESGNMKLQVGEHNIISFLKPIAYSFTSYAERKCIDFKCEFETKTLNVFFEKEKIEKVVTNLLSNAFKYTPEYGQILFRITDTEDSVEIIVKDTGVGIAEEHLQYVFNRFYQVNDKKYQGTGIGLALTKELVELHGGKILVESTLNEGTQFTISLRKGDAHFTSDEIDERLSVDKDSFSYSPTKNNALDTKQKEKRKVPAVANKSSKTILIAEDNEDLRSFIKNYLSTSYKILEAENGVEALKLAQMHFPDLIITDIMMPEMNGYELGKAIKSDEKTSHIPMIMLTAKASQESEIQGLELGADYYITKPFNPQLLELRIQNLLNTRKLIREKLMQGSSEELSPKIVQLVSRDEQFLKKILACVEENIANSDFSVNDLCKESGLSRTQLYRKLKGLVGQSANEFIRSIRMKRAAQLLEQNQMTIAEVTYQVGFNDLQYFRDCFKKQFGVNPSEYLESLDKKQLKTSV